MGAALVIGYGNPLRGDDGVGPAVVAGLADDGGPHATVLDPVQLTPELAVDIAGATVVIFIDARASDDAGVVRWAPVAPTATAPGAFSHATTPAALLMLARELYGAAPPAWVVSVGAASFAPGADLSPTVSAAVPGAVAQVRRLIAAVVTAGVDGADPSPDLT